MKSYVVRTTLFEVEGESEKPIAQAEADDFRDVAQAAQEFLERLGCPEEDIENFLLCAVPELDTVDVAEEDEGDEE